MAQNHSIEIRIANVGIRKWKRAKGRGETPCYPLFAFIIERLCLEGGCLPEFLDGPRYWAMNREWRAV